jgi:phosphohistidine swiveling domain-containing protein
MFSSLNSIQSFKNSGVVLPSWPSVTPSLTTLGTVGSGSYTYAATNRICASTDFTYIFQCSASGCLRSTNRGSSWSTITFSTSSNNTTCACSSTGQYVVFCSITSGKINYSNDYGASFSVLSTVTNIPASNFSPWSCNISDDGQYILIGRTNGASLSTDAGASWTILEASDFTFGCDMDSTGQYMVYGRWSSTALKVSTNYGSSFSALNGPGGSIQCRAVSASDQNKCILANNTNDKIFFTRTLGATSISNINVSNGILTGNISVTGQYIPVGLSKTGNVLIIIDNASTNNVIYSLDNGYSFRRLGTDVGAFTSLNISNCCVSRDGQRILLSNSATLYMIDFGQSI